MTEKLTLGKLRKDQPTGEHCSKTIRTQGVGWRTERPCGAALSEVIVLIPAEIKVTVCPACDVVEL